MAATELAAAGGAAGGALRALLERAARSPGDVHVQSLLEERR